MKIKTSIILSLVICFGTFFTFGESEKLNKKNDDIYQEVIKEYVQPDYTWQERDDGLIPEPPVMIKGKAPFYPPKMKRKKIEGYAEVDFVIEVTGKTSHVVASKASNRYFEKSAEKAVMRWVFSPSKWEGNPIAVSSKVPLQFKLEQ